MTLGRLIALLNNDTTMGLGGYLVIQLRLFPIIWLAILRSYLTVNNRLIAYSMQVS